MTAADCPNGCDLGTFGTHQGPPDCDLTPADPGALLLTGTVHGPDGQARRVEVAVSSRELAAAVRHGTLDGLSIGDEPL